MDETKEDIMNSEKMCFSREEIAARIMVPKIVETDLKRIVEDRLQQCGLYHRVFSRIKTPESLEHKYRFKEYNNEKRIQDLVGIRIDMYFEDDLSICQGIMERSFELVEWSHSESKEEEFKATKTNGVFRLPEYLKAKISADTWDMGIDDTFEIQLKTMFFEGWHEIEHDMRYKQESVWTNRISFSRYFNSILATLELCDKSMVTLFEDMGHDLYKAGQWAEMIRVHFRVKMGSQPLYPEVQQIFNDSYRNTVDNLAKRLFKCPRKRLVDQLMKRNWRVPINVNTIVALLNECLLHDDRLKEIFKKRDVYNAGRLESQAESSNYELKPLLEHKVFQSKVAIDTSRLGFLEAFFKASSYIYQWITGKFGELVGQMPEQTATYYGEQNGYSVRVIYDSEHLLMRCRTVNLDLAVGGRMWVTCASVTMEEDKLWLYTTHSYVEPESRNQLEQGLYFSFPKFYRDIADNIGIMDVVKCTSNRRIIKDAQVDNVYRLITDRERSLPVVVILSEENDEGMMDERWLGQFRVSDFTKSVWRYTHVYTGYAKSGHILLDKLKLSCEQIPGIYVFWPGCYTLDEGLKEDTVDCYSASDVKNCSFGRHRETRNDVRTYDIVKGGQGFYHKLLMDIRDYNVTRNIGEDNTSMNEYYWLRSRIKQQPVCDEEWKQMFHEYTVFNKELISENQALLEKVEQLQKEIYQLEREQRKS